MSNKEIKMRRATIIDTLYSFRGALYSFADKKFAFDSDMTDEVLWCEISHIWDQINDMIWLCRHYWVKDEINEGDYQLIQSMIYALRNKDLKIDDLVDIKMMNRRFDQTLFDREKLAEVAKQMSKKEVWEDWYGQDTIQDYLKSSQNNKAKPAGLFNDMERSIEKVAKGEYIMNVVAKTEVKRKKFSSASLDFN